MLVHHRICSTQLPSLCLFFFFFNDTATTEIYTLSLHDALPISAPGYRKRSVSPGPATTTPSCVRATASRSEEHTSELQSPCNLVCRLLLEKKKKKILKALFFLQISVLRMFFNVLYMH